MDDKKPTTANPIGSPQRTRDDKLMPPVASRTNQPAAHDSRPPATVRPLYFSHDNPATPVDESADKLNYETRPVSRPDGVTAHPQSKPQTAR